MAGGVGAAGVESDADRELAAYREQIKMVPRVITEAQASLLIAAAALPIAPPPSSSPGASSAGSGRRVKTKLAPPFGRLRGLGDCLTDH